MNLICKNWLWFQYRSGFKIEQNISHTKSHINYDNFDFKTETERISLSSFKADFILFVKILDFQIIHKIFVSKLKFDFFGVTTLRPQNS